MKFSAVLLLISTLIDPSEQAGLRRLSYPAPDCDVEGIGFQTCKNDAWYYECLAGFGALTRPVAGGTKCCKDNEREGRIFMAFPSEICGTLEPTSSPSAAPSATPSASPSATPSASPSASPSATPSASPSATPSASPSSYPTSSCNGRVEGEQWCFSSEPTKYKECANNAAIELEVLIRPLASGTKCCVHPNGVNIIEGTVGEPCPTTVAP